MKEGEGRRKVGTEGIAIKTDEKGIMSSNADHDEEQKFGRSLNKTSISTNIHGNEICETNYIKTDRSLFQTPGLAITCRTPFSSSEYQSRTDVSNPV